MGTYPVPMSAALDDDFRMPLVPPGEKCLQTDKFIFFGPPYLLSLHSRHTIHK